MTLWTVGTIIITEVFDRRQNNVSVPQVTEGQLRGGVWAQTSLVQPYYASLHMDTALKSNTDKLHDKSGTHKVPFKGVAVCCSELESLVT